MAPAMGTSLTAARWLLGGGSGDRRVSPGVALGPVIDMPVVVQCHMHRSGIKVVDISVVAQMQSPMVLIVQKTIEILSLQSIGKVVDVTVGQVQQIPRVRLCEDSRDSTVARVVFVPGQGR